MTHEPYQEAICKPAISQHTIPSRLNISNQSYKLHLPRSALIQPRTGLLPLSVLIKE